MSCANPVNLFGALRRRREANAPVQAPTRPLNAALGQVGNTVNTPVEVYYVIIGRGPMAVVNHLTLRADRSNERRIGDREVMHIGFPNPWPKYFEHGLGQPNHLLSFPSFDNDTMTSGRSKDDGLNSHHFGERVDAEFDTLNVPAQRIKQKWVALIQARGENNTLSEQSFKDERPSAAAARREINIVAATPWPPGVDAPYRLCLYDAQNRTELVYASHIDICTGPGRPRVAPVRGQTPEDPQMANARTPPWITPEEWDETDRNRKVMNGVDAIRDEVRWASTDRVCITAGGGVGLNAAEKARDAEACADWFGRTGLTPILLNPRNRTFLQYPRTHPSWRREYKFVTALRSGARRLGAKQLHKPKPAFKLGTRFELGDLYHNTGIEEADDESNIFPAKRYGRMGRGASLRNVSPARTEGKVRVQLSGENASIRDYYQKSVGLRGDGAWDFSREYRNSLARGPRVREPSTLYDRLVIPNGQESNTLGQPSSIGGHLGFQPFSRSGRMVCLQTADGLVRVLGAACNNYTGHTIGDWTNGRGSPESQRMWEYHATLPKCAVPDGFIICAINTAVANGYFRSDDDASDTADHNINVNTMTYREANAVFGGAAARAIIAWRNELNGYASVGDLCAVLATTSLPSRNAMTRLATAEDALRLAKNEFLVSREGSGPDAPLTPRQREAKEQQEEAQAARDEASRECAPFADRVKANREKFNAMFGREDRLDPSRDPEFVELAGGAREQCLQLIDLVNGGTVVFAYPSPSRA